MNERLQFSEEYIYRLKIIIVGDKNVGKSSLIYTYVNERSPKSPLINEDLNFFVKRAEWSRHKQLDEGNDEIFECKMHLWDTSGSLCTRQTSTRFVREKLLQDVGALVLVYTDDESFLRIRREIWENLVSKRPSVIENAYLVQNCFNSKLSPKMEKQVEDFAKKEKMTTKKVNSFNVSEVCNFFSEVMDRIMFQISDGKTPVQKMVVRDLENRVVLKNFDSKQPQRFQKRYNRCC